MYCPNCGTQFSDSSLFCSECGNKFSESPEETKKNHTTITITNHFNYILNILKHPVTTMKESSNEITDKTNLIYIAIITLLIPFIKVISIEKFSFNLIKSIIDTVGSIMNDVMLFQEIMVFKMQFNQLVDNFFPFKELYIAHLISYFLFYGLIVLIIVLMYKLLFKINVQTENVIRIITVLSVVNLLFTILLSISFNLGIVLMLILTMLSKLVPILLLYIGFNNLLNDENKLIYLFTLVCTFASVATTYITVKYVISFFTNININQIEAYINKMF